MLSLLVTLSGSKVAHSHRCKHTGTTFGPDLLCVAAYLSPFYLNRMSSAELCWLKPALIRPHRDSFFIHWLDLFVTKKQNKHQRWPGDICVSRKLQRKLVVLNVFYGDYTHRSCPWYNSAVWQFQMDMVVWRHHSSCPKQSMWWV